MKSRRPVFLNLLLIRQPLPAIVSILHRISGVLLFLALPVLLSLWQTSLASAESFIAVKHSMLGKFTLFLAGCAMIYHACAGLRFLLLDLHWGMSLPMAQRASKMVLLLGVGGSALWGLWLW